MPLQPRFRTVLLEAIHYFATHGFTNESELTEWLFRLSNALDRELPKDAESHAEIASLLTQVFNRDVTKSGIAKRVPGASKYTIDRIAPNLRAELDRRIFAAADLIRLNKAAAKAKTLQRFSGWVTSVPPGGGATIVTRDLATEIQKPSKQLKFERRRVAIDQGHKLSAAIAHVVAMGQGAIAAVWHDRGQYDHGYDARPEHLARAGKTFLIRNSWAMDEGLVKKAGLGYTDDIEQPAELPYCSCYYEYIDAPRDLPAENLTAKGRAFVEGRAWVAGIQPRADAVIRAHPDIAALDVARDPSEAQREAGNYRHGHVTVQGMPIAIETPQGALRHGVSASGKAWSCLMPTHYGYFKGTEGADGDELDVYIGRNLNAPLVWVVEQVHLGSGEFDEHKVLLGFGSRAEAIMTYEMGFSDGMGAARCGNVLEMSVDSFKDWGPMAGEKAAV